MCRVHGGNVPLVIAAKKILSKKKYYKVTHLPMPCAPGT